MPIIDIAYGEGATKGLNLYHYIERGSGESLLLFHGFTGSTSTWEASIDVLAEHYHVFAIDLPGHGKTIVPAHISQYSMNFVTEDIYNFYLHFGIETAHILGYSMGGRFALAVTDRHFYRKPFPVKSLILESASAGLKSEEERQARKKRDDALADKIEANGIEWFVDFWESISLWDSQKQLSEQVRQNLRKQRLANNPKGLANSLRGMGTGVMPSLWDKLYNLPMPVKLIAGELDTKFVAINQEMAELIPNVSLSIIEDAGHTVHLEKPAVFTDTVLEFLQQQT